MDATLACSYMLVDAQKNAAAAELHLLLVRQQESAMSPANANLRHQVQQGDNLTPCIPVAKCNAICSNLIIDAV